LAPPKQLTLLTTAEVAFNAAAGWVMITCAVAVLLLASVTVTV
jgi:hypothetical protein